LDNGHALGGQDPDASENLLESLLDAQQIYLMGGPEMAPHPPQPSERLWGPETLL
jgi:hypothetical protein